MRAHRPLQCTLACFVAFAVLLTGTTGCRSPAAEPVEQEEHLRQLSYMYGTYMRKHRGGYPPNEAAFKEFINKADRNERERFGVTDADKLFISPRDGQPYKVAYGKPFGPPGGEIIAYEQQGAEGKRYIADILGDVREVDEAEFQQRIGAAPK